MNKTMNYEVLTRKREVLCHGLFWLLYVYFSFVKFDSASRYLFSFANVELFSFTGTSVFLTTFYFNYLVIMPWVFPDLNWKKIVAGILAVFIFFVTFRYLLEELFMTALVGYSNYFEGTSLTYYIYDNLFYGSFPLIASVIFWVLVFVIRLLEHNKFIEAEKRSTEVKFLKAQLNPHFMFNTLNNIYSLVYFKSDKALPAIEKLSELMRYTTYESSKEMVTLEKEINYIKSYLALDQLRQEQDDIVQFHRSVEHASTQLPPFLLSPLVENALKHGDFHEDSPIVINLKQSGNVLSFYVSNTIGTRRKDKLGGIGLENLKQNLAIYYPNAHELRLNEDGNTFIAQLEINLDGKTN